jgi:serine/threonine protein kinase
MSDLSTDDAEDVAGRAIGKYELVRLVGRGGMGNVYEAINPSIGKRVALKMLDSEVAKHRDAVARFQREAQAASAAESPHIVEIFDSGITEDGVPFIVMELLRGESLASLLKREPRLSSEETTRIMVMVLRGLARAHEAGIVHRDLKPDNIFLVDRQPEPTFAKILDFGISKIERTRTTTTLTREGTVLGTPSYMSPEQAQGEAAVDARSDLWSVGAILYECLGGRPPFEGVTYEQIIVRICTTSPRSIRELAPNTSPRLVEVVERCLARERDARFASAAEVLAALGDGPASSGAVRIQSVNPMALTPTLEAPARVDLAASTSAPRSKYTLPIGLGALVCSGAFVVWGMGSPNEQPTPSATGAAASEVGAGAASVPKPTPVVAPVSAQPSVELPGASPSVSTNASAVVSAAVPAAKEPPRPSVSVKASATSAAPVVSAAVPSATAAPKGVAGDLQIQHK